MPFYLDVVEEDGTIASIEMEKEPAPCSAPKTAFNDSVTHLLTSPEDWGWEQLRDYVLMQVQKHHGRQVRNVMKEKAIFQGFVTRWGDKAPSIAKYAFEIKKGVWQRAPITVNRFTKNSDEFFAQVIADQLDL